MTTLFSPLGCYLAIIVFLSYQLIAYVIAKDSEKHFLHFWISGPPKVALPLQEVYLFGLDLQKYYRSVTRGTAGDRKLKTKRLIQAEKIGKEKFDNYDGFGIGI